MPFLDIDGSYGEGGGQIVRTALFLSTVLGVPVRIRKIRLGRRKPGLKRQHLHIVRFLKRMCEAKVEGDRVGSLELSYTPGRPRAGRYAVSFGTPASISLFLQTVLPVMLLTPGSTEMEVTGGTEVPMSPTIDWLRFVYLPLVRPLRETVRLDVLKRGYLPAGGGRVKLTVSGDLDPKNLKAAVRERLSPFREKQGRVQRVHLLSVAHELLRERRVVERQVQGALEFLQGKLFPVQIYRQYVEADSIGTSVTLWVEDSEGNILGADSLGRKGKPAEEVGREGALKLWEDWITGATVDRHLADHLIPWLALTGGCIRVPRFTGHLETNLWVCERFLGVGSFRVLREERVVCAVV